MTSDVTTRGQRVARLPRRKTSRRKERKPALRALAAEENVERMLTKSKRTGFIDLRVAGEPWAKRLAFGESLRAATPRESHATWSPPKGRPDPVSTIERTNVGRQKHLIPLRMARMAASPFAFLRGAADVMAWDLSHTPNCSLPVVMDGDAHMNNFGLFGTPQRNIVFDMNDFDEATIGPWEWDLKRLVASINVAGRENGLSRRERRRAVMLAAGSYRNSMARLSRAGVLDVWYEVTNPEKLDAKAVKMDPKSEAILRKAVAKARLQDNRALLKKTATRGVDGGWRFKEDPPVLTRVDVETRAKVLDALTEYANTLPRERRFMLDRYHVVDVAHRVVGVGSVGTRAYVALLFGNSDEDALFLQVKEAIVPAHAPYLPRLPEPFCSHQGNRIVFGQRLLQAVGDPLLGWTQIDRRPFFVRQMKNMKGGIEVAYLSGQPFEFYSRGFAALLARAHARTGDAARIAGYCGTDTVLDAALADWAEAYGDQTVRDHAALKKAIASGRVAAAQGVA